MTPRIGKFKCLTRGSSSGLFIGKPLEPLIHVIVITRLESGGAQLAHAKLVLSSPSWNG